MSNLSTSRSLMLQATIFGLLAGLSGTALGQQRHSSGRGLSVAMMHPEPQKPSVQHMQPPAPVVRQPPAAAEPHQAAPIERRPPPAPAPRAPLAGHLADWMNQHSNLTLEQQHQALRREPGFTELPQATQQRMQDRLTELNKMPSGQRQVLLARNEAMERLTPEQRGQVRGAMQQLGALPPDQRKVVARDFRQLRDLPPNQRWAAMTSDHYWPQLNGAQRETLSNLIRVEPMLPPPEPKPLP